MGPRRAGAVPFCRGWAGSLSRGGQSFCSVAQLIDWGWVYSSGVGPGRLTARGRGLLLGQQWAGLVWPEMGVVCLADRLGAGPGPRPQSGPPGLSLPSQSGGLVTPLCPGGELA